MPIQITTDVVWNPSISVVANAFFASADQLNNLEPAMEEIVGIVCDDFGENFRSEGRPTPWEPLAESTVMKRGSSNPILQDTGEMAQQLTDPASWVISVRGQTAVAVPTGPEYSLFHITGTVFMPARPWDYVSPETQERIMDIVEDFMLQPLEEAGWH